MWSVLCFSMGESSQAPGAQGLHRIWPYWSDDGIPWTHDGTFEAANKAEEGAWMNNGVNGKSELFGCTGFNVTQDMPMEPMHLLCEGIAKMMMDLKFPAVVLALPGKHIQQWIWLPLA